MFDPIPKYIRICRFSTSCKNPRENGTFSNVKYFPTFPVLFSFLSKSTESKRPGDFLKAYRSARTVSTVITTLCQHFSLYQPTYPRRLFAPLWGFKYVDVEIAKLALSFFLLPSSSHSESSETLFAVPSSRKLTVQPPAAFPTAPPLPPDSFLSVCIRLLRKFRPVFVQ